MLNQTYTWHNMNFASPIEAANLNVSGYCGAVRRILPAVPQEWQTRYSPVSLFPINPYPTAFPYGNGMVLHFYQQQESSTTKTVHKVINKGLKTYV